MGVTATRNRPWTAADSQNLRQRMQLEGRSPEDIEAAVAFEESHPNVGDTWSAEGDARVLQPGDPRPEDRLAENIILGLTPPELEEVRLKGMEAGDTQAIAAQREALRQMQEIARGGGLTAADRAAVEDINRMNARETRGNREALIQQMAMRGMRGGGTELAGALAAQEAGADRAAHQNAQVAVEAQRRAMQAMQSSGAMGGQMREAQDRINMYNSGVANQQTLHNADLAQQDFENRARIAGLQAGHFEDEAERARRDAEERRRRDQETYDRVWNAASSVFGAAAGAAGGGGGSSTPSWKKGY